MKRLLPLCGFFLFAIALAHPSLGDNWPGWRGDGSGVSKDADLPVEWGPDKNIVWKTKIEGNGISSPIVWQGQVFVTTAVQGTEAVVSHAVVIAVGGGLLLLTLMSVFSLLRRRRLVSTRSESESRAQRLMRFIQYLDQGTAIAGFLFFLICLGLLFVKPSLIYAGSINRPWLISGALGMLGLVAAIGLQNMRSIWRPVGAMMMLAAAAFFHFGRPDAYGHVPIPFKQLLLISGPLCAAAAWSLFLFLLSRRVELDKDRRISTLPACLALLALVALQFSFLNYLRPRIAFLRSVVSVDRDSGGILWQRPLFAAARGPRHQANSYATPTPVTDGTYLFAHFGSGMAMMDLDGRVKWKKMIPEFEEYSRYGAGSSPVMHGDLVIYAFMAEGGGEHEGLWSGRYSYLLALNKETGEEVWRVSPVPEGHDSYNTPLIVHESERTAVLLSTYNHLLAYDADSGQPLWWVKVPLEQPVPSLVADSESVYLTGGLHGPQVAAAVSLGGAGDVSETHVKWKVTKGVNGTPSPILYRGLLYWVTDNGILVCVDAESGERLWRERVQGSFLGSPIAAGGRIYLPATDGTITVVEAGREFKLLAVNSMGEGVHSSPAVSQGRLFVRGREHLFCISATEEG